jgi:hypothetical protein
MTCYAGPVIFSCIYHSYLLGTEGMRPVYQDPRCLPLGHGFLTMSRRKDGVQASGLRFPDAPNGFPFLTIHIHHLWLRGPEDGRPGLFISHSLYNSKVTHNIPIMGKLRGEP